MFGHRGFGGRGFGYGGYGGEHIIMVVFMIVIVVLLAYLIFRLIQQNKGVGAVSNNTQKVFEGSNALQILNERFAKGEINEEEYIAKKKLLQE